MGELRARLVRNPDLVDVAIALGLTALSLVILLGGARDIGSYEPFSIALLLFQTLPLIVRRRLPLVVLATTVGATILHAALAYESLSTTLGSLIALFTVAERCGRRTASLAGLATAAAFGAIILVKAGIPAALSSLVQTELTVFVAWLMGIWSRERRQYVGTVEERAIRAEREREARAERAVAEERERIARELHDVVTHHVSVIVIQAGAGLRAIARRPEDVREALTAIDASGRRALADMRRMLGILGPRAGATSASPAGVTEADESLAPMPGLDRLGELIEHVRTAGLPVELSIAGEARQLDPGVELSAYRIIQEALTNTLKHAPGARSHVEVRYEPAAVEIRVTDAGGSGGGPLATPGRDGHGLIGMRERVAIFGGSLDAGPAGGGFRVVARLPVDREPSAA